MINAALILTSLLPNISYETKAARLPVILAELEAKTGMDLECAATFKNDVLVIRVENQAPLELLAKVAQASVGKWNRDGETLRLVPDEVRRKQQEEELLARREKDIQRMLDRYKEDLKGDYDTVRLHALKAALDLRSQTYRAGEYEERLSTQRAFGPLERLAIRTLIEIGPRRLAEIKPGQRLVFSRNPTRRQYRWPKSEEFLPEFFREWNLYQSNFGANPEGARLGWTHLRMGGVVPQQLQGVDRIWLSVVDPLQTVTSATAQVNVVNKDETVGFGAYVPLAVAAKPADSVRSPELPDAKLTLDPITVELRNALRNSFNFPRPKLALDPKFVAEVSQPLKNEPLAMGSELYLQYAKARKVNLVAWINDNAFGRGVLFDTPTVAAFDQASRPYMVFDERDNWLVMTPSSPVEARRSRDDRQNVERLIQSVITNARLTFDAKADYIVQRPVTLIEGIGLRLASFLDLEVRTEDFKQNEQLLRLYGSLSPAQRKAVLEGKGIPYANLSPAQRTVWELLIYGASPTRHRPAISERNDQARRDHRISMGIEPTEEWANGIPPTSVLTLNVSSGFELRPEPKGTHFFTGEYDLASQIFFEQNPGLIEGDIREWRRPDTFTPLEKRQLRFEISIDERYYWAGEVDDKKALSGPVKRDQLPPQLLKAILERVEEMTKKQAQGANHKLILSSGGRRTPPPP